MNNSDIKIYENYMRRCIELAKLSYGQVSPNPLVGAVVLDKNGDFAGEGRHEKYGFAHAEVNAIKHAQENKVDIEGGTIIVNLEPCSHYGKTPPCADLIIEKKLKKVIIGCKDPNPKVAGNGIKKLEDAGIKVVQGVLEDECRKLNEIFFKNHIEKLPFVAIKIATTMDGKIATKTGSSKWITSENSREYVQELRNMYDAILTGSGTVLADNPSLTCRMNNGKGRNPVRIIIDSELKTLKQQILPKVFQNDGTRVILVTAADSAPISLENVEILKCPKKPETGKINLNSLFEKLYENRIYSVLVEAGGLFNGAVLKENFADKIYQFIAPKIIGDNDSKSFAEGFSIENINDSLRLEIVDIKNFKPDLMIESKVVKRN